MVLASFEPWIIGLLFADFVGAVFLFFGTIPLIKFLKIFGGVKLKQSANAVGVGLLLFAFLHEFGEFICRSGIHGGFPQTLLGKIHILVLGTIGPIVFFIGSYLLYKNFSKIRGDNE